MLNAPYMSRTAPPLSAPVNANHAMFPLDARSLSARPTRLAPTTVAEETRYPIRLAANGFGQSSRAAFAPACANPRTTAPEIGHSSDQPARRAVPPPRFQESIANPTTMPAAAPAAP